MSQGPNFDPRLLMPPPRFPPRGPRGPMFRVPRPPGPRHWRGGRGPPPRPYYHPPYPPPSGPRGHFLHPRHFHTPKVFFQKHKEKMKNQRRGEYVKKSFPSEKASEVSPPSQQSNKRQWNLLDAERALNFENEYNDSKGKTQIKIEFPDTEVDRDNVRCLHPNINNVYFKSTPLPRYCFVQLRPDADVDKVLADLNSKSLPEFNGKCLRAYVVENKQTEVVKPESIDPYTLYIGNIPPHVNTAFFKEFFPNAVRKDIGHAQKLKNTRYAFVRFNNLKDSIDGFKRMVNKEFDSRSVIVRFKRYRESKNVSCDSSQVSSVEDNEDFHYVPETRSTVSKTSTDSNEDFLDMEEEFNPDEYDMDELNPPPRPPSLALLRYLRSNDEQADSFSDIDTSTNLTVLPDDVISVQTTDSLLDLDTPYK
ncbi:hypothetical protein WDU94_013458 [Cyamophila willieti]